MSVSCFEPYSFPVDRNLIKSLKCSSQRYGHKLAESRKKTARKKREENSKRTVDDVHSLDTQRILLETTIKNLCEEIDRLGNKAEKVSKVESVKLVVAKSDAFKRAANDKPAELEAYVEETGYFLNRRVP